MPVCPSCFEQNANEAKICKQCRAAMPRTCGKGHQIDPSWMECAYCKYQIAEPASAAAHASTAMEAPTPVLVKAKGNAPAASPEQSEPRWPLPAQDAQNPRKTMFFAPDEGAAAGTGSPSPGTSGRRIVGLLVTHSWRPEGEIFPVREGRNLIGRDAEKCDIVLPDQTMSGVNSHILFRRSFLLGDAVSMGGTDLNGVPIEEQFVPLPNYASIRAGSTNFIFIMVDPATLARQSAPEL